MNDSVALGVNVGFATRLLSSSQYSLSPKQVIMGASVSEIKKNMHFVFLYEVVSFCTFVRTLLGCTTIYSLSCIVLSQLLDWISGVWSWFDLDCAEICD